MNKRGRNKSFSLCNSFSKNRRGSHIDVILSFVIFISFIVFFYALIQPNIIVGEGKTGLLTYMGAELIRNITGENLTSISLSTQYGGGLQNCLQLQDFFISQDITDFPRVIVKNSSGANFPAYQSPGSNDLYIDVSADQQSSYSFEVYYSADFNNISGNPPGPCAVLIKDQLPNKYSINQMQGYSFAWEESIKRLIGEYDSDYNSLKEWFNLSQRDNFGFDFTYQNLTTISTESIARSGNVYSGLFPVVYIPVNGTLDSGRLSVGVW